MPDEKMIVIEVVGEGKTDIGPTSREPGVESPTTGVVTILLHKLCGCPNSMKVIRRKEAFLVGKTLEQKVKFSKRQAKYNRSAGFVCVVDTEGDHPEKLRQLCKGRDAELHDFPAAVGVAHACIEAWLLSDAKAIARGVDMTPLAEQPPERPEGLPAPRKDGKNNPKVVLARCAGKPPDLASSETSMIAAHMKDMNLIRARCPIGFAPFADEVGARIRPLFGA